MNRRRPGPPRKRAAELRPHRVGVSLNPEQFAALKRYARARGQKFAAAAYDALLAALAAEPAEPTP